MKTKAVRPPANTTGSLMGSSDSTPVRSYTREAGYPIGMVLARYTKLASKKARHMSQRVYRIILFRYPLFPQTCPAASMAQSFLFHSIFLFVRSKTLTNCEKLFDVTSRLWLASLPVFPAVARVPSRTNFPEKHRLHDFKATMFRLGTVLPLQSG